MFRHISRRHGNVYYILTILLITMMGVLLETRITSALAACGSVTADTTLTADLTVSLNGDCITIQTNNNIVFDCAGYTITCTDCSGAGNNWGIGVNAVTGTIIKNCNVAGFDYGVYLFTGGSTSTINTSVTSTAANGNAIRLEGSTNNNVINSSFSGSNFDIQLIDSGVSSTNNIFLNTTYSQTKEQVAASNSLTRQWYLDIYVNDSNGNALVSVNVTAMNSSSQVVFSENTTSNGYTPQQIITEYDQVASTKSVWTNYTINVTKPGYNNDTRNVNISSSMVLKFNLTVLNKAPSFTGNYTNNTAPKINENISMYVNLSDDTQLSFYLFEWNGSGTNNTNINGTIDQKTYNITLNLSINLNYGSVIAWKVRFNDSANIWNQTPYHFITIANTNPVINELLCYNLTNQRNCSAISYHNNLTAIRVNCTDADTQILNISYNLTNVNDTSSLIYSNATANDTVLFNYSYNQLINDSGLFNLTITCHDKANITTNSTTWYIEFGSLKTNLTIIFNDIQYYADNVNVRQHDWFKATLNITCSNGECGTVNASLDPASLNTETKQLFKLNLLKIILFSSIFFILSVLIFTKLYTKLENKLMLISALAIFLFIFSNFTSTITGFAASELVNTTAGATPFYTNNSNPLTLLNATCLTSMHDNDKCALEWYVNSTGNISNVSVFFAFVNGTNYTLTNISNNLNITIKSCIVGAACSISCYSGASYSSDCVCGGGTYTCGGGGGGGGSGGDSTTTTTTTETKETTNEKTEEEITETEPTETIDVIEGITQGISKDNYQKTMDNLKINRTITVNETDNTTSIELIITPNETMYNLSIYEQIPKCIALLIKEGVLPDDIEFKNPNFKVITEDQLIMWHFEEVSANEKIDLSYKVKKRLVEDCIKLLNSLGIADQIGGIKEAIEEEKPAPFKKTYLIPIAAIPAVAITIIYFSRFSFMGKTKGKKKRKKKELKKTKAKII